MKKNIKIKIAMTLTEVMIVFFVIGIVAAIISGAVNNMTNKTTNKYMTTAAFLNIQNAVSEIPKESDGKLTPTSTTFCTQLASVMNIVGSPNCSYSVTLDNVAAATPNFITTNGMRFYNFGTALNANNDYIIYVDIDGANRGSNVSTDVNTCDVVKFKINTNGSILPVASTIAADNTDYLSATAYGVKGATRTMLKIGTKSIFSYKQAKCLTGEIPDTNAYCTASPAQTTITGCPSSATYDSCEVVLSIPKGLRDFK